MNLGSKAKISIVKTEAEILKDPNDICECIIALYSFNVSKEKMDQNNSVVLSKLAKKEIESLIRWYQIEVNARGSSYLQQNIFRSIYEA